MDITDQSNVLRLKEFVSNVLGLWPQKIKIKEELQVSRHLVGNALYLYGIIIIIIIIIIKP